MGDLNLELRCDVCGKPAWWSLSRVGDPCPDDEGHLVVTDQDGTRLSLKENCDICGSPYSDDNDTTHECPPGFTS